MIDFIHHFQANNAQGNFIQTLGLYCNLDDTSSLLRKMANGKGGNQVLRSIVSGSGSNNIATMKAFDYHVTEQYCRFHIRLGVPTADFKIKFMAGSTEVFHIRSDNLGVLTLSVNSSDVATGTTLLTQDYWHDIQVYYLIANSGQVTVTLNRAVEINYSGDTNNAAAYVNTLAYVLSTDAAIADCIGHSTYKLLWYDGGSGTAPSVGDTITASGGKTGTVIYHVGDGTTGKIVLNTSSSFANNDAISNGGTFTANANGNIITSFTTAPEDIYFSPESPTGVGTTNQFTPSTGTTVSCVDDIGTTADYMYSSTDTHKSTFTYSALPSDVDVAFIMVGNYARYSGSGINYLRGVARVNSADYDSLEKHALTSDWTWFYSIYEINPNSLGAWDYNDLTEFGAKVLA